MSNINNISRDNQKEKIDYQSNNTDNTSNNITNNNIPDLTKISLDDKNIDKIILLKQEGNYFKKGEKIVKYFLKGQEIKPKYISSPIYGKLLKYDKDEKLLILEECTHDKFYYKLCLKCGFQKDEEFNIKNDKKYKKCGFISNEFTFSKKEAVSREKEKVNQYLSEKKLVLILDLDNTILHACPFILYKTEVENLTKKYGPLIAELLVKKELSSSYDKILIKFRPFIKSFFKNIKNKYEIVIYTHGTKEYARSIIQYINSTFEEDSLSTDRMMSRELDNDGFAKCKSIKNVFPTMENMVLILDDHIEVWKESGENFICIYPYRFFNEKEIIFNSMHFQIPKEKYLKCEYDNVLYCVINLLLYVHKKFYEFYSKFKCMKSVQRITKEKLWSILSGKKVYYHQNYFNLEKINKKNKSKKKKEKEKEKNNEIINELKEKNTNNEQTNEIEEKEKGKEKEKSAEIINEVKESEEKDERNYEEEKKWIDVMKEKVVKLGGIFLENDTEKLTADLFLTNFYDNTDKVIQEIEEYNTQKDIAKKIPILHSHYVEICYMFYSEVDIEDFYLTKEIKCLKYLDLNKIFEKNKPKIDKFYGNLVANFES